jgi:hypothetical protein
VALWQQLRAMFATFEASRRELPYENRSRIIRMVSASIVPYVMTGSRATSVSALGHNFGIGTHLDGGFRHVCNRRPKFPLTPGRSIAQTSRAIGQRAIGPC